MTTIVVACTALLCSLGTGVIRAAESPLPGLVGYWRFEEGTGTTTADSSGNGLTGTLFSGPTWVSSPLGSNALDFTTGPDGVDLGNPAALQITGALTLSAWVYADSLADNGRFIAKGGGSGQRGWSLNLEGNNTWAFQVALNSTANVSINPPNVITGQWVHVAGVYDPTVPIMRFYVYGELVLEKTDGVPTSQFNSPVNAWIGRRANGTQFDGRIDEVRVFNRALTGEEIAALPELVQTPLTFVTEPVDRTVAQFRPVTFTSAVSGSPPHFFQWFQNGLEIPGANGPTYTIPSVTLDMSPSEFSVTVSNFVNSITSSNALLTVTEDTAPPTLVSVGSPDGNSIGVCFSEPVDITTATSVGNYDVNDFSVIVMTAELRPDGRSVRLTLDPPITGSFTVKVSFVMDLSGNEIAVNSPASGIVAGMVPTDLAAPFQAGSTFSCTNGDFDLTAGGDDIWDSSDQGHVALKAVSGDFDVKVRVIGLTPVNDTSKAGLMVRESADAASPTLHLLANPPPPGGRGWVEAGRRATTGGATANWGTNFTAAVMPNVWLRLRRTSDLFTGFYSTDGSTWVIMARAAHAFPDPVQLGLAATAGDDDAPPTLAEFRGFSAMVFSNATLSFTQNPTNTTVPQNSTVNFSGVAAGTGAPAGELVYQWQRDDGTGTFTNIVGANSSTLSLFARPADHGARFRVQAYLAGLVATSQVATLTLTPDVTRPTLESVAAPGQGNQVRVLFSEEVELSTATTIGNYVVSNATDGALIMISAADLSADGRAVTLTTDFLSENAVYRLYVSGVQDLGQPPNTILPNSQAQFQYNSLVGYWRFEEGSGTTTADSSGNGFTGTLLGGPAWMPGLFGNYALDFTGNRVDVGNPPALQITGPITLAAWVYVDSLSDNGRIVTKGGGSGQRGWSLNVEGTDVWAFQVAVSGSVNVSLNVGSIPIRKWTHVAGVYDPSVPIMRLYTNGIFGGEKTDGVPTSQFNSPLNVSIGARPVNQTFFDGKIDEVRVHARALSAEQIAVLAAPRFLPATIAAGQIQLDWGGYGKLEWAPAVTGSWTPVDPEPAPPYTEAVGLSVRLYRLATP